MTDPRISGPTSHPGYCRVPTLIITVGLPASGKTTRARTWIADNPHQRTRINRDDLRQMMGFAPIGNDAQETAVTDVQRTAVTTLLLAGWDVVVDDTNLHPATRRGWYDLAIDCGANHLVWDLTDVTPETCIERDQQRAAAGQRATGETIITAMHRKYLTTTDPTPTRGMSPATP